MSSNAESVLEAVCQPSCSGCLPWCQFGSGHVLDPDVALFGSTATAALILFVSTGLVIGTRVTLHGRIGGPDAITKRWVCIT